MWFNKTFKINNVEIGEDNPVYIIAEAGVNHNGDIELAKKLVDIAKDAGANAVKFQTFIPEKIASKYAKLAKYQSENLDKDQESQVEMLKQLALSQDEFIELKKYAEKKHIEFLSTPFDEESAQFLNDVLNVSAFKIGSGDITNIFLLEKVASFKKPIILSTGMSYLQDVEIALKTLIENNCKDAAILHCVSVYPAKIETTNMLAITTLKTAFRLPVGYSDHTKDYTAAIVSVALGAKIIEKHFTIDKSLPGPDHKASLEPEELKLFVKLIRDAEKSLGTGVKVPTKDELDTIIAARKSLVASRDIPQGKTISRDDITAKRPGTGLPPFFAKYIIGRRAKLNIKRDELITFELIN